MSKPLVLVFGEDSTDTAALRTLTKSLLPDHDVQSRREPIVLSRNAARRKRGAVADRMAAFARAEGSRPRVIVVTHRDCDAVEPSHEADSKDLEKDLRNAGIVHAVAACPAWELEAWWMLFPEALRAVRTCWKHVDYGTANVGMISNAKERLTRDLRPSGSAARRCPDYTESDSVRIAEEVVASGLLPKRIEKSQSLHRFHNKLKKEAE